MNVTIYEYYRVLGHRKSVFRTRKVESEYPPDKYNVVVPDDLKPYVAAEEDVVIEINGSRHFLDDVMTADKDGHPIICVGNGRGGYFKRRLEYAE